MLVYKCYIKTTWSVGIHCFSTSLEVVANASANIPEFCENAVLSVLRKKKVS